MFAFPFNRKMLPFPMAAVGLASCLAYADPLDTLQFEAGQSVERDSNVFRLSDSAATQPLIGSADRSDTVAVTHLGLKLNKPYGLQRFELDVNVQDHRYQRYSKLDFTAFNYAAAWRWSFTPRLRGNLSSERREYVDPTADVQNFGQVSRRTERATLFDAEYEIDGPWRLVGGVFDRSSSSSQPLSFEADTRVTGAEGGVRYVFPSSTSVAYRFRSGEGEYPGRLPSPLLARSFSDREHELRLDWATTGRTTVRGRVAHFERSHDDLSARDFSGFTGQLDAVWAITAKTRLAAGAARELGSYQSASASHYEGHRFFVAPTWKPSEKTALRANYSHGVRNYSGALPGFVESRRRDTTRLASLAFDWLPWRALKLTASLERDRRSSTDPRFDYQSNRLGLTALATF